MKKRVEYMDLLRFIAIISVITIHINAVLRDYYIHVNKIYYFIYTFFDSITRTAVPLFFIFTGYFLLSSTKKENYLSFIKRKMPKLIDSFIFFSIIYYLINSISQGFNTSIIDFIRKFSIGDISYHFWYMYAIIIIYLFIPFEKELVKNLDKKQLLSLITVIFILGNVLDTLNFILAKYNYSFLNAFILNYVIICNNYLFIGYYLKEYEIKHKKIIYVLAILSIILMPTLDILLTKNGIRNDTLLGITSIFPIFPTLAIFTLVKDRNIKLNKKIITKCAELSLYIYLIHVLVMDFSIMVINRLWNHTSFFENILFTILLIIIVFFGSYLLSIIYNWFHEKILNNFKKKA